MGIRVLMADDSKTMRTIIRRSLQAVGVNNATEAGDGNEAIALFKAGEFDLVLTDWNMPGQPGVEVARDSPGREGSHYHDHDGSRQRAGCPGHPGGCDRLSPQAVHPRRTPRKARQARLRLTDWGPGEE